MLLGLSVLMGFASLVGPKDSAKDASLLASADARIERYRKANVSIRVMDQCGQPVPDAKVRVEQIRHSFLFGCAAISLLKHKDAAQEEAYQKRFSDLFNFATVLTYWPDTNPEPGKDNIDKLTAHATRLKEMSLRVKA